MAKLARSEHGVNDSTNGFIHVSLNCRSMIPFESPPIPSFW